MESEKLGKITKAEFGIERDYPSLLGITLVLEGKGWGTCVSYQINMSENAKWESHTQKGAAALSVLEAVGKLLKDAKVNTIDQLVGKPIEFFNMKLGSRVTWDDFRILTEVL